MACLTLQEAFALCTAGLVLFCLGLYLGGWARGDGGE